MVDKCANPKCNKPLHYLRDGRIFTFDALGARIGPDGLRTRYMEHYWLCGDCSPSFVVERGADDRVSLHPKKVSYRGPEGALAS